MVSVKFPRTLSELDEVDGVGALAILKRQRWRNAIRSGTDGDALVLDNFEQVLVKHPWISRNGLIEGHVLGGAIGMITSAVRQEHGLAIVGASLAEVMTKYGWVNAATRLPLEDCFTSLVKQEEGTQRGKWAALRLHVDVPSAQPQTSSDVCKVCGGPTHPGRRCRL